MLNSDFTAGLVDNFWRGVKLEVRRAGQCRVNFQLADEMSKPVYNSQKVLDVIFEDAKVRHKITRRAEENGLTVIYDNCYSPKSVCFTRREEKK